MMHLVSKYQNEVYRDRSQGGEFRARWALNRMWEMVENGATYRAAKRSVGVDFGLISRCAVDGEIDSMKSLAKEIKYDNNPNVFASQREMESIVRWYANDAELNEWAIKAPLRHGEILKGKRHNITKPT